MPRTRLHRLLALAVAVLAPMQLLALTTVEADGPSSPATAAAPSADAGRATGAAVRPAGAPGSRLPVDLPAEAEIAGGALVDPDAGPPVDHLAGSRTESDDPFAERYPQQAAAHQDRPHEPSNTRWALLIGINEHLGRVSDNYGARQDAMALRSHLLSLGWRDDHILVITDRDATRDNILRGIEWLAARTDDDSTAVFHYSGHSKKWYGQDHDGDGETTDEGLWPTDDRFIPDSELVAAFDAVDAGALWINIASCNAAGFNDPGLERPGRLLTFSSSELNKSYEWPDKDNSVYGYYLFDEAFAAGKGDLDGDGVVTVEEAVTWAGPRAHDLTRTQRYGPQDAVMIDEHPGPFLLDLPPPPAPAPSPNEEPPGDEGCVVLCNRS